MNRLRLYIFGSNIIKVMCLFSISYQGIFDIFLLVVLNLIKVVSARFPHYKVAVDIFPFVINRCLERYKFSSNPSSPQTFAYSF